MEQAGLSSCSVNGRHTAQSPVVLFDELTLLGMIKPAVFRREEIASNKVTRTFNRIADLRQLTLRGFVTDAKEEASLRLISHC
jgi:hypothetical protein